MLALFPPGARASYLSHPCAISTACSGLTGDRLVVTTGGGAGRALANHSGSDSRLYSSRHLANERRSRPAGYCRIWHPTGVYGGVWISNVDTARRYYSPAGTQAELNLFAGYGRRLGTEWVVDLKVVRYLYLEDPAPVGYDYTEYVAGVAWRERFYASVSVSPDSTLISRTGAARNSVVVTGEISMQQPLSPWLTSQFGAGYQDLSDALHTGYAFGGTSLALQLRHVTFEFGYAVPMKKPCRCSARSWPAITPS